MKHFISKVLLSAGLLAWSPCMAGPVMHEGHVLHKDSTHHRRHLNLQPSKPEHIAFLNQHSNAMGIVVSPVDAVPLPDSVDNREFCSPVWNQRQLGACTAFAGKSGMEMLEIIEQKKLKKELDQLVKAHPELDKPNLAQLVKEHPELAPLAKQHDDLKKQIVQTPPDYSALFHYYNERKAQNTLYEDSGASIALDIITLHNCGICQDSLWDYKSYQTKYLKRPGNECYTDALNHMDMDDVSRHGHAQLSNNGTSIMTALANHAAVIIGMSVYESFMSKVASSGSLAGVVPVPNTKTEQLDGGHALFVAGYKTMKGIDGTESRHYIVKNSWSESWGDKGYCYIPASVIEDPNLTSEVWAITKVGAKGTPAHQNKTFEWMHKHFHAA